MSYRFSPHHDARQTENTESGVGQTAERDSDSRQTAAVSRRFAVVAFAPDWNG